MAVKVTTEELYEQAKKVLRAANIASGSDFILACNVCGDSWPEKTEMGMVETHFQISHPEAEKISLDLIWIGIGAPPVAGK